jgi:hypothetical protein
VFNKLLVQSTRDELIRLKRELHSFKIKRMEIVKREKECSKDGNSKTKSVRFAKNLVSQVYHRPFTDEEDIAKLYFVEEELEGYEYDRATTEPEQVEVIQIAKGNKKKSNLVEVEYKNKRRCRDEQDDDDSTAFDVNPHTLQLTLSDLSALRG